MNLHFSDVGQTDLNGRRYMVQRAPITREIAPRFWWTWRRVVNKPDLERTLSIRKENGVWAVYRLLPVRSGDPPGRFPVTYQIKSVDKLLPYQPQVVTHLCNALVRCGAALDGSDTGLGKTYTALACCRELELRPAVVCRKAGIAGWKRACAFMGQRPVFIANWEQAKGATFPFTVRRPHEYANEYVYTWRLPKDTLLIFDEVHLANHRGSQNCCLYRASKGLASLSLSATVADKVARLEPIFDVLGVMSPDAFEAWARSLSSIRSGDEYESLSEQQDLSEINGMLFPGHGFRISYEHPQVRAFFPDAVHQVEVVTLSPKQEREQNKLYLDLLQKVDHYRNLGKQAEVLVADLRYRQASELLKADALAELALEYMYEGKSVCIFVNFRETMAYLARKLDTRSLIFGDQDRLVNREEVIRAFQSNETRLVICMADAGGQSIDLHDVHGGHPRVSLVCPTYNAINLKQVLGRTRRAGSKSVPIIKLVYAAGTVEEKVADRVLQKVGNISALHDGDLVDSELFGRMKQ